MVPRRFMLITAGFLLSTFVVYQFMQVSFSAMISGFAMIAEEVGIEEPSVLCLGLKRASKLSVPFKIPKFYSANQLRSGHPSPR
jgi:hypothetical protein